MGERAESVDEHAEASIEELRERNRELHEKVAKLERVQDALRDSEERYRNLFENAIDLIQIVAPDGRLLFVNEAWRRKFGYDPREDPNLSLFDIIAPDCGDHCVNTFSAVLAQGRVENIETTFLTRDGRTIELQGNAQCTYDEDGSPLSTQCIFQDVTAQKEREMEQLRAEKIASLGVLAGGLAHDFNNFLTAILGNISLARVSCEQNADATRCLLRAERASVHAQGLSQQLLTFSKGGTSVKRVTHLGALLRESAEFATRGSKNKCTYHLEDDLWPAEVDTGQINQTIHNLVINASQAMPEGGTIVIRAKNAEVDEGGSLALRAGRYVQIEIEDCGHGIPSELLERIFDPYYTTKDTGSGLGLAVTYSVIRSHGGQIDVKSTHEEGTTFTIYLPASAKSATARAGRPNSVPQGQGRVLLMDDDPMIRELGGEMLAALGYEAETAANGEEAVRKHEEAREAGKGFDLLLLDLTVPGGMGGDRALEKIRETSPEAKAIISSGYAYERRGRDLVESGSAAFLNKPYDLGAMARVLQEVLESE